jgi:hypothetical protein
MNFRIIGSFIRGVDTGKVFECASFGFCVQTLGIALHAIFDRCVDEHFDKLAVGNETPDHVTLGPVRRYEGAKNYQAALNHKLGDFTNASDVFHAIRLGETEVLIEAMA